MEWLAFIGIIALIGVAFVGIYIARQGDAHFEFLVNQRTDMKLEDMDDSTAVFSCNIPFVNNGSQDGTILDCYPRHLLPQEQFDEVEVASLLELETSPRRDGYFEAIIVLKGTGNAVNIMLKFSAKSGDIRQAMASMVDMPVDIVYQIVARSDWYITKNRMIVTAEELLAAMAAGPASEQEE
jgi:hypothetical protein